jgi:AcrR family transcriptional regulator
MNEADRRVKRSRKLLQDAFRELLAEKGFHAISVQDVAERADVNRGTFYAHFPDKYALLETVAGESFREAIVSRIPEGTPFTMANLELLTVAVLDFLAEFSGHCRPTDRDLAPLVETSMQHALYETLVCWLRQTPGCDETRTVSPETAATVMSWAIFGSGLEWSRNPQTDTSMAEARQILTILAGGLAQIGQLPTDTPTVELATRP